MSVNYVQLNQLQSIISNIFDIEERINEVSETLKDKEAILNKSKQDYIQIKRKCESLTEDITTLKIKHEQARILREDKEKQVELITVQREFDSLKKEIDECSKKEQNYLRSFNQKWDDYLLSYIKTVGNSRFI